MHNHDHTFVIEILAHEGDELLGRFPAQVDWVPAREHLRLQALRRGNGATAVGDDDIAIEPVWDAETGEPHATGARLSAGEFASEVTLAYFKPLAVELSAALVEKKVLKSGDRFRFKLYAFRSKATAHAPRSRFTARDATPPLRFIDSSLAELRGDAVASGEPDSGDVPVFLPQTVLDEVGALTREAAAVETGGVLIGRMHRDSGIPEIGLEITAQIPARFTESKTTSLAFTAETWTAVRAALDLRDAGEMMCGWWHSHPSFAFCNAECPAERRRTCAMQRPFLSADDLHLHRVVFPKAFHVALLANNADAGLGFALFGWSGGTVQQRRGYHILGADRDAVARAPAFPPATSTGDHTHGTPCEK
jgi:proteasome lid subunit RPN8/RPN11